MTCRACRPTGNRRPRSFAFRLTLWTLALLTLGLAASMVAPLGNTQPPPPGQIQPPPRPPVPQAPVPPAASGLDQALSLIAEARQSYQGVQDYTCIFLKREQLRGQMQPENVVTMKVKTRPFSVYLHWQGPKAFEGQEVCYVAGKNNGMMRVHSTGLLGAVGFVSLEPKDPRALQNSRHTITEAGIGNLIERYGERYEGEKRRNGTQVAIGEYEFNKRRCMRVECRHPGSKPGEYYAYRNVIYFDKEHKLPVRSEAYDWPRAGGPPDGDLLECFSFVDLRLNVGVPDAVFNH